MAEQVQRLVTVKTLRQLLDEPVIAPHYLVKPLLPVGGFLLIAGDVKTYKSFLTLNFAYQLAGGQPILGRWPVMKPLTVLYIEMEVGEYLLRDRSAKIDGALFDQAASYNLHIVSRDLRIQLDTPDGMARIRDAVDQAQPDVVILDPIIEFHNHDENHAVEMKKMLWQFRCLLNEYHSAMIIVHHTAKTSEFRPGNNPASVRGSYLAGAATSIINIEKPVAKRDDLIRLNFTLRADAAPKPMMLEFNGETGGFTIV